MTETLAHRIRTPEPYVGAALAIGPPWFVAEAVSSLTVVAVFAAALTAISIRVVARAAVA